MLTTILASAALCLFLSYVLQQRGKRSNHVFPPGPKPKPIIGNALDMPFKKPWIKFLEWSKEFDSDIIHLRVLNTRIVILNKLEDMVEVLDKRWKNYSSRSSSPVAKMLDIDTLAPFIHYGDVWRKQRRFFEENLNKHSVLSKRHILEDKVHLLLYSLYKDPERFEDHCNMLGASVNLATTFGYDVIPGKQDDPFVVKGQYAVTSTAELVLPGRTLIATFPILRHIPSWFPGASTQRFAATVRDAFAAYRAGSVGYVKKNMESGTARDSILKTLLQNGSKDGSAADPILLDAVATLYFAAVESTGITLATFILAMMLNPMVQKKAQEEIDAIVGSDRLPTLDDRSSLPYVEAVYREVSRWRPVTPIAFPHIADGDDMLKGYYIPKGTVVIPNVWAVTRNEEVFPDPEAFKPERFIKDDGTLVEYDSSYIFGFGRRICPGKYMSELMVWLAIATMLATFNISKAKDENGNVIGVTTDVDAFSDAVLSRPRSFKCSIVPRSSSAELVIENTAEEILQALSNPR